MNEIYNILATLRDAYIGIALQFTNKKYEAEDAVQELYIYLLNIIFYPKVDSPLYATYKKPSGSLYCV